jgi:hypothetical protein
MFRKFMKGFVRSAAAAALILFGMVPPATAGPCAERQEVTNFLGQRYGETIQAMGITDQGALLDIYVSEQGTWTIVLSLPNGPSCIVASGTDWEPRRARTPET